MVKGKPEHPTRTFPRFVPETNPSTAPGVLPGAPHAFTPHPPSALLRLCLRPSHLPPNPGRWTGRSSGEASQDMGPQSRGAQGLRPPRPEAQQDGCRGRNVEL